MDKPTTKPTAAVAAKPAPAAMKKPAAATAVKSVNAKASAVSNKIMVTSHLRVASKTTDAVCIELTKKVLKHKTAVPGATEVGGINKADMMKLIETLDAMGTNTYKTVCALRELHDKMN